MVSERVSRLDSTQTSETNASEHFLLLHVYHNLVPGDRFGFCILKD